MRCSLTLAIVLLACLAPGRAQALPVFAHRFGLSCQACHTTVPHLNGFGEAFLRSGFRLPNPSREALPVAVKVNLAYTSDADPSGLPKAIVDEVELLTAGAAGPHLNYFLEQYAIDGGRPGLPRDAWLQYNADDSRHVRVGEFTLALPVDPETERDTEAHYLVYDQTVGGNPFNFFDPRIGIEAYYSAENNDGVHLAAVSSYERQSGNPISGIDLMAYGAKSFGDFTLYAYRYEGQRVLNGSRDGFFRQALGARQQTGKFELVGVLQNGKDSNAGGAGTSVRSSGGFAEAHYAFSGALTAVARYDRSWDALGGSQHQTVLTLVTRPARNVRFTLEDQITDHHTLNAGWLFAY